MNFGGSLGGENRIYQTVFIPSSFSRLELVDCGRDFSDVFSPRVERGRILRIIHNYLADVELNFSVSMRKTKSTNVLRDRPPSGRIAASWGQIPTNELHRGS